MSERNNYTDIELLNALVDYYKEHGVAPSSKNFGPPSPVTYWKRYGSWSKALRIAGVVKDRTITPKQLAEAELQAGIPLDWLSGFWEGEGSFSSFEQSRKYISSVRYPQSRLNQSDYEVLLKVKAFLRHLEIQCNIHEDTQSHNTRLHYRLSVTGQESFELLAQLFKGRFKSIYKQEQFRLWCEEFGLLDEPRLINKAVVLLSGGMDSTTLLAYILEQEIEVYPIGINYGQKHLIELESAKAVVQFYKNKGKQVHDIRIFDFDLGQIGNSALTDDTWSIPDSMKDQIRTVVPFRNGLLITVAASFGYTQGINDVYITPVIEDFDAYRDCRIFFYNALQETLRAGSTQPSALRVHTPFIDWWKKDVIKWGIEHGVPYDLTHSCYRGSKPPCRTCPACVEREASFEANGVRDPLIVFLDT